MDGNLDNHALLDENSIHPLDNPQDLSTYRYLINNVMYVLSWLTNFGLVLGPTIVNLAVVSNTKRWVLL